MHEYGKTGNVALKHEGWDLENFDQTLDKVCLQKLILFVSKHHSWLILNKFGISLISKIKTIELLVKWNIYLSISIKQINQTISINSTSNNWREMVENLVIPNKRYVWIFHESNDVYIVSPMKDHWLSFNFDLTV